MSQTWKALESQMYRFANLDNKSEEETLTAIAIIGLVLFTVPNERTCCCKHHAPFTGRVKGEKAEYARAR